MWKRITMGVLLLALCGCIKTKDELTINADGSGQVRLETDSAIPADFAQGLGGLGAMGGPGGVLYPPVSDAEAGKFFPAKDFKVTVKQNKAANGDQITVVEATFKDVNALLASPYGRAHQLSLTITNGSLVVRGVSGMEAVARMADVKPGDMGMIPVPGLSGMMAKTNEMRGEFRVTLPNPLSSANGTRDGNSADWTVERAKCKDGADFAQQLGALCEAQCPADGVKMTPVTPVRLGLLPFAELATGVADVGIAVDTNQIAAAAKFTPYGLQVTRSLDLSGEGGVQESTAQLIGAVTIPLDLAPKKWGQPELIEATDAKGNDLKPGGNDQGQGGSMQSRAGSFSNEDSDEDQTNTIQKHVVTLTFRPPDWKVNEISRIKSSVRLQYFGGSQVVKLTNAVPPNWVADITSMMHGGSGASSFGPSERSLSSPALEGLGLSVSVQMCMVQGGVTMLMLQVQGKEAALTDAQVFDADGKPWPTYLSDQDFGMGEAGSCQIMVAGKPKPPFSLAFLASGSGAAVDVPILVEHVPVSK
jgi:hypothetical protein